MRKLSLTRFGDILARFLPVNRLRTHTSAAPQFENGNRRATVRFCPTIEVLDGRNLPSLIASQVLPGVFPTATSNTVTVRAPALSASSPTPQQILLTSTIAGAPTGGTVDFTVAGLGTVTGVPVVNGVAQAVFTIPVGADTGGTVTATYSGTFGFQGSTSTGAGNGTLTFCDEVGSTLLGTTLQTFAVLAGSTVTNTGSTVIVGNVGVSPGTAVTGFPPGIVTAPSVIYATGFTENPAVPLLAQTELTTAYTTILTEMGGFTNLTGVDLGGLTLTPGRYHFDNTAQLTGTLILDNQNDPGARYDFQIGSTLTTASAARVLFINGGADNVYWQVGSSATLGTGTEFAGNILAQTSITLNTGATIVCGRALARTGAVTMDTNFIDPVPHAQAEHDQAVVVPVAPTAPTLIGPNTARAAGAGFDTPTFTWNSTAGADHYYLWVSDTTVGRAVLQIPHVTGTSWTASAAEALTPGHNYTWWVQAVSSSGVESPWSSGQHFSLAALAAPTLISPNSASAAGAGFDTPTFTWDSTAGADHYYLWVSDTTVGRAVLQVPTVTGTSWTASAAQALTPGHDYTWWVQPVSTNGSAGPWSSGRNFSLAALAAPLASSPLGNATSITPTFTWSAVAGAGSYVVWVNDQTTGQSKVLHIRNLQGTTWTPTAADALEAGHRYVWWAGVVSGNGEATMWSSAMTFATAIV